MSRRLHDHRSGCFGIHPSHSPLDGSISDFPGTDNMPAGLFTTDNHSFFIHDFPTPYPGAYPFPTGFSRRVGLVAYASGSVRISLCRPDNNIHDGGSRFRRISPPEFSHSKRLPTVPVGILQKLGSRTLTCTCRWRLLDGIFKQVAQIPFLSAGVQHAELFEKPLLKGSRTGLAFCFEAFDFRLEHLYFRLEGSKVIFPILFLPFQFRFLELAFTDQLLRIYV